MQWLGMPSSRPVSCTAIGSIVMLSALAGCATESNHPRAECRSVSGAYELSLSGTRRSLSHSLIRAFVVEPTYETSTKFLVPRLSGVVEASELPVENGKYRYGGSIQFVRSQLTVNLHYIDTDRNMLVPLSWNGQYILGSCSISSM
jgi:hypothetical protein